ncbi:MAG: GNAT family N-acetyltransferase [Candidatus Limnocylindrales bacterium]
MSTTIRPAEPADMRAAFAVFRRSLVPYLHRLGVVDSPDVTDAQLDEAWVPRSPWIEHLWRTAAENWVAIDDDGRLVGWALSVQRGGVLELAMFFVDPTTQSKGVGKALLERAFPMGRGPHRSIIATRDPRAMSRYLRAGVRFITSIVDFEAKPRMVTPDTDLVFERLEPAGPASIDLIAGVEAELLGHRREVDTAFLLTQRPAWIARRAGAVAGFAFGYENELTGPIGALDPGDIPALLDLVENDAAERGAPNLYFSTPLDNHTAVEHLLARSYTIDPFVASLLADSRWLKTDRWVHTGISYIV